MDLRLAVLAAWLLVAGLLLPMWRPDRDDRVARRVRHALLAVLLIVSIASVVGPRAEPARGDGLLGVPFSRPPAGRPVATPIPEPEVAPPRGMDILDFVGYELRVTAGPYRVVLLDDASGRPLGERRITFPRPSWADVEAAATSGGLRHWRVTSGWSEGWSYVQGESLSPFSVIAVFVDDDGERVVRPVNVVPSRQRPTVQ
jgi:hypothetical protein